MKNENDKRNILGENHKILKKKLIFYYISIWISSKGIFLTNFLHFWTCLQTYMSPFNVKSLLGCLHMMQHQAFEKLKKKKKID